MVFVQNQEHGRTYILGQGSGGNPGFHNTLAEPRVVLRYYSCRRELRRGSKT